MTALYNKYRPHTFDSVVGQQHVVRTLHNAILRNLVGHAYLFTGPRGTGKTTLARIFAHAVNCTPRDGFTPADPATCDALRDGTSLDLIEIDAASFSKVDDVRALRETVALPPTRARYKVYIIDEAHMLSSAAWNAFLKTLEEPPTHALFIFATTEAHKVPETILSRIQRFDLGRIPENLIIEKLAAIAQKEKISIDADALVMIARAAEGGLRDAESLFAQIHGATPHAITADDVRLLIGVAHNDLIWDFLDAIIARQTDTALRIIDTIVADGSNLTIFTTNVIASARDAMLFSVSPTLIIKSIDTHVHQRIATCAQTPLHRLAHIIDVCVVARNALATSPLPQLPLELAVIRLTTDVPPSDPPTSTTTTHPTSTPQQIHAVQKSQETSHPDLSTIIETWPRIIATLAHTHKNLAATIAQCVPFYADTTTITLRATSPLHADCINAVDTRLTLEETIATILGVRMHIVARCIAADDIPSSSLIADALRVMGGGRIMSQAQHKT